MPLRRELVPPPVAGRTRGLALALLFPASAAVVVVAAAVVVVVVVVVVRLPQLGRRVRSFLAAELVSRGSGGKTLRMLRERMTLLLPLLLLPPPLLLLPLFRHLLRPWPLPTLLLPPPPPQLLLGAFMVPAKPWTVVAVAPPPPPPPRWELLHPLLAPCL